MKRYHNKKVVPHWTRVEAMHNPIYELRQHDGKGRFYCSPIDRFYLGVPYEIYFEYPADASWWTLKHQ